MLLKSKRQLVKLIHLAQYFGAYYSSLRESSLEDLVEIRLRFLKGLARVDASDHHRVKGDVVVYEGLAMRVLLVAPLH